MGSERDSGPVVFLLGAGASVDAGAPTVKQLTEQFPEWVMGNAPEAQNAKARAKARAKGEQLLGAYEWVRAHLGAMRAVAENRRKVDIELVLEALGRIGGKDGDPFAAFVRSDGWVKDFRKHEAKLEHRSVQKPWDFDHLAQRDRQASRGMIG